VKRFLIPGLALVHLWLHANVLWDSEHLAETGDMALWTWLLGLCQGALLALWIALGGRRSYLRVILAAAAVGVYLGSLSPIGQHSWATGWLALTTGEMALLTAILLVAHWTGLELTSTAPSPSAGPRFQFYLRDIFAWTTALAAVLGAARFLHLRGWSPTFTRTNWLVAYATSSAYALALYWAVLGQRRIIARILVVPAVAVAEWAFLVTILHLYGESLWAAFGEYAVFGVLLVASLSVVRWAGYRLSWQWRPHREAAE
jgi:hypothetical protein